MLLTPGIPIEDQAPQALAAPALLPLWGSQGTHLQKQDGKLPWDLQDVPLQVEKPQLALPTETPQEDRRAREA